MAIAPLNLSGIRSFLEEALAVIDQLESPEEPEEVETEAPSSNSKPEPPAVVRKARLRKAYRG